MASKTSPDELIQSTLSDIKQVIDDLQARPGYGRTQKDSVDLLNGYTQLLKTIDRAKSPSSTDLQQLNSESQSKVLPLLSDLISQNIAISGAGPLSTSSPVTPTMARKHNGNLTKLQDEVQDVVAQIAPEGQASPADPDDRDQDISPDQAALELLTELMQSQIQSDPALVAEMQQISGQISRC